MSQPPDVSTRPLLIGGMHRSGTSLTASLFASAGIDLGRELLGSNASNPLGHYEDLGFFTFHRRALVAQGLGSEGYTATARGSVPAALEPEAEALVAARMRPGAVWGWKEPRTTLFLDFWQERLPDARHVFVFRRPWEVADSLFRRGDETFALNPAFALEVWTHYNRLILDFVRRHPARCLIFEISQVIANPHAVVAAVQPWLDVPLAAPEARYTAPLFHRDDGPARATIVRQMAPEAWRTYWELREQAGVPATASAAGSERSLCEIAMLEWSRASRAGKEAREAAEAATRIQVETEARVRAETEARVRAETEARLRTEIEARVRTEIGKQRTSIAAAVRARVKSWTAKIDRRLRRLMPRRRSGEPAAVAEGRPVPWAEHASAERRAA